MALQDILLRITSYSPLTTKGSELTMAELDANIIELYDGLVAINSPSGIQNYSGSATYYQNDYVISDGIIYRYINTTASAGNTPVSSPTYWSAVSVGTFIRQPVKFVTYATLVTMVADSELVQGQWYYIVNRGIYLKAESSNRLNPNGIWVYKAPDFDTYSIHDSTQSFGVGDLTAWDLLLWENRTGTNSATKPPSDPTRWKISGYGVHQGGWSAVGSYSATQTVSHLGKYYYNVTGTNSATAPSADHTRWASVQKDNAGYSAQLLECSYDLTNDWIYSAKDKYGNSIEYGIHNPLSLLQSSVHYFRWGVDTVRGCKVIGGIIDNRNNLFSYRNNTVIDGELYAFPTETNVNNASVFIWGQKLLGNNLFSLDDLSGAATVTGNTFEPNCQCENLVISTGAFENNSFKNGAVWSNKTIDTLSIQNCVFDGINADEAETVTIAHNGKYASKDYSTFEADLDIDDAAVFSANILIIPKELTQYVGRYRLISTDSPATTAIFLDTIGQDGDTADELIRTIRIKTQEDLTVNLRTSSIGSSSLHLDGGVEFPLATQHDFIELEKADDEFNLGFYSHYQQTSATF